ncbi:MASE1 domain-containing protein, partial [Candidatus Binatia bacterium]|nr:MASE1 domain-containing protein [Candidatus Binatia bacterium]
MSEFWSLARSTSSRRLRRPAGAALVVGGAYLAAAFAGHALSSEGTFANFWPPNGVLLAALLIAPRRLWPYVLLATCPANLLFNEIAHQRTLVSLAYWMVNAFEALGIAVVLQSLDTDLRFVRRRARSVLELAVVAVLGTTAGGFLGALATLIARPSASLLPLWASWTMGDLVAILTFVPLLVTMADAVSRPRRVSRECAAFGVALGAITLAVVGNLLIGGHKDYVFEPLMVPLLGWAALRLGVPATAWAVAVTTVLTIANSMYGSGKVLLPDGFTPERAMAFQAVLSALAVTFLGIAAAIADAREAEADLERRDVARRDYLAAVMHEIQAPLDAILGAVRYMDELRAPALDDRFAHVRAIERAARQILDLSGELGREGRRDRRHPLVIESVWLPVLWRELGDSCARLPRPQRVELQWQSPAPAASVISDRWRIAVVVQNLVASALAATPAGTVRAACMVGDGTLSILVLDPGCGVSGGAHGRESDAPRAAGDALPAGDLGLATVRRFVAELGGAVSLTSDVGGGSE